MLWKKDSGRTFKAIILLLLLTILFFWNILLTRQFSLLTGEEEARQWYSWLHYCVINIKQGALPLWDPYTGAGSSFPAEMQMGAFNPLNLLPALIPLSRKGVFSLQLFHQWYAFIHFLAACFMFALIRELGLGRFSALIGGICFAFGGFLIHTPWRHMYESAIWLPLIFLFFLRSLNAQSVKRTLLYASASGLALGMTILAGGLHVTIMAALALVAFAAFMTLQPQGAEKEHRCRSLAIPALACLAVLAAGLCAGAVQVLPSIEYSRLAFRWIGGDIPALPVNTRIPYAYLDDGLRPDAFLGMLFAPVFGGSGETISPYIGVFPLLAALIGIVKCWSRAWVRYLTGLAVLSFLYALGAGSFIHGALYAIVPRLWMAREADRFILLTCFAMAILAAFGVEHLLSKPHQKSEWSAWNRVLAGVVIVSAAAITVPSILMLPPTTWISLSVLMILMAYGLFQYLIRGNTGASARVLAAALILFDLNAFNYMPRNKIDVAKNGTDHLERLISCRGAADFLKTRPGPYRVRIEDQDKPNIGHLFQIPTIHNTGVTALKDYAMLNAQIPELLNVRYILKPSRAEEPGAVYQDAAWKVYESPNPYPAAWIVHETAVEPVVEALYSRVQSRLVDFRQAALLGAPLDAPLEPAVEEARESAVFRVYQANRLELDVQAQSRGLLVLSEIYYPGWRAAVNGNGEKIHKVDGLLRGVVVPKGRSRVVLRYSPVSVMAGGAISLAAFLGTLIAFALHWRKSRSIPLESRPVKPSAVPRSTFQRSSRE